MSAKRFWIAVSGITDISVLHDCSSASISDAEPVQDGLYPLPTGTTFPFIGFELICAITAAVFPVPLPPLPVVTTIASGLGL